MYILFHAIIILIPDRFYITNGIFLYHQLILSLSTNYIYGTSSIVQKFHLNVQCLLRIKMKNMTF